MTGFVAFQAIVSVFELTATYLVSHISTSGNSILTNY